MIYGIVKNQKLDLRAAAAADTIDYLTAKFSFMSSDWEGLVKYAHFRQGETTYSVQLIDDKIDEIDHLNLSKGEWEVYLHGNEYKDGNVKKRITTNIATFTVEPTGVLNGEPFPEIEPSVVEQLAAEVENKVDKITGKGLSTEDYTTEEKEKLGAITLPVLSPIELKGDDNKLLYPISEIAAMWSENQVLKYDGYYVTNIKTDLTAKIYIYYLGSKKQLSYPRNYLRQVFYWGDNTTPESDIIIGGFSPEDYSKAEKDKLEGIEAGAQVNTVNDVQDINGNSLVSEGIARLPDVSQGIKVINDDGTLKYSGGDLYLMFQQGKDLRHRYGEIITFVEMTATMPPNYKISYLQRNNYSPYNLCLYYDTINNSSEFVETRVFAGRFSQESFTSAEKTKLNNIEDYAEVNDVTDVQDSDGNSLVQGKIAVIPKSESALTDEEMITICSILNDFITDGTDIIGVDSNTALAF